MLRKKKQITIALPQPCKEEWENMTPAINGRICDRCQYEITDYTDLSDRELINRLYDNSPKCGRFRKDQLNRVIEINEGGVSISPIRKIAAMMAITTASIVASGQPTNAQTSEGIIQPTQSITNPTKDTSKSVRGIVLDQTTNQPLPNVQISIKNTDIKFKTDDTGEFEIYCYTTSHLVFELDHYVSQTIDVKNSTFIQCQLKPLLPSHQIVQGGMIPKSTSVVIRSTDVKALETTANNSDDLLKISGVVTDENGEPLIGANILIKNTSKGTISDLEGHFTIEVPLNSILMVKYVGYNDKVVPIKNDNNLNIVLDEATMLGEVVVGGLITVKRNYKRKFRK